MEKIDKDWTSGEKCNYKDDGYVSPGSRTRKFSVFYKKTGVLLAHVKWFVPWRQYVLFPLDALLDMHCMREIADFCEKVTAEQRAGHKPKKKRKRSYVSGIVNAGGGGGPSKPVALPCSEREL